MNLIAMITVASAFLASTEALSECPQGDFKSSQSLSQFENSVGKEITLNQPVKVWVDEGGNGRSLKPAGTLYSGDLVKISKDSYGLDDLPIY